MAFLNPLVLLALAAAAIPILIHLFHFRRPRTVDFPTLRFLRELEEKAMRRMRLRNWLLLALRTLAIACLVLAFARPAVESAWAGVFGSRVPTATALVVDTSPSMSVRDAQGDLLGQARELARATVAQARPGDEFAVVPTGGGTPILQRRPELALDAVEALELTEAGATMGPTLARAFATLGTSDLAHREVLILSDLQATTFADSVRVPAPEGVTLTLLPLGDRVHANTAVTDVRVRSRVVEPGQPVEVEATLVHYGPQAARGAMASLYLDGERAAQATADLEPGLPQTVRLTAVPRTRGWLEGEVRLEPDAFPFDDARPFVLHVPETRRVLLVRGDGQQTDLLDLALTLGEADRRFEVTAVPEAQLAAQPLDAFDVVMLVGPGSLASGEAAALDRAVRAGTGLVLFPNADRPDALDGLARTLGVGGFGTLTGALGGEPVASLGTAALDHPLFAGLLDESRGRAQLESPDVFAARPPTPAAGQTLIALSSGPPFLHELRVGQGTVLSFAVAPDPRWSDLPTSGLFVPLLHRAVYLLTADAGQGEMLAVGEGGTLRIPGATPDVRVTDPEGEAVAAAPRAVPGGVVLELDGDALRPGVYTVSDAEGRVLRRFAAAAEPRESDLTPLDAAEAARRLEALTGADVRVLDASGGRGLAAAERAAAGVGVELWNVFLLMALVFLLAEQLVAMRWRSA